MKSRSKGANQINEITNSQIVTLKCEVAIRLMASTGASLFPFVCLSATNFRASASNPIPIRTRRFASSMETKRSEKTHEVVAHAAALWRQSGKPTDLMEHAKDLIKHDGGPPRWFSPFQSASRPHGSPLLLYLPGLFLSLSLSTLS